MKIEKGEMKNNNILKAIIFIVALTLLLSGTAISANYSANTKDGDIGMLGIVWDAMLNFSESGGSSDCVVFGEATDAHGGKPPDSYDVMKPSPPMPPYIRAWFDDGLASPFDCLNADYRYYPGTDNVWNLTVVWGGGAPTTDIMISWDVNEIDLSEYNSVILYDVTGAINVADMLVDTQHTFTTSAMIPKSFQIIAIYEVYIYTLSAPVEGCGWVYMDPPGGLYEPGVAVELLAVPCQYWMFAHWGGDLYSTDNPTCIIMNSDKSITAHFYYTLPIEIIECGNVIKEPEQSAYPVDTDVQLTAEPCTGWSFDHWSGDIFGTENPTDINIAPYWDTGITATFTEIPFIEVTNLSDNWNLISVPFNYSVNKTDFFVDHGGMYYTWADAVSSGIVTDDFFGWDRTNQMYLLSDVLEPGYGYWVWAYYNCILKVTVS